MTPTVYNYISTLSNKKFQWTFAN